MPFIAAFFFFFALALNGAEKAFGHLLQWEKETKKIGGLSKSGDFKLSWLNKIHEDSKIVVNVKWYNLFQLEYLKHKTLGKKRKVL